jgi:succinoglycan biosynthesis transport protein ExoP
MSPRPIARAVLRARRPEGAPQGSIGRRSMIEPREFIQNEVSLQQCLNVVRRRRWTILGTVALILAAGGVATVLMTPIYEARAKLLVRATAPQVSALSTENPLVDLLAMTQPESVETQVELLRSQPLLDEALAASRAPQGAAPTPLRGVPPPREVGWGRLQVRVAGLKETNIIEVTVAGPDAPMAARVANTILDHYLERTRLLSLQEIRRAREFVQGKEQKAKRALERAEAALLRFRRANRVAELTAEQRDRTQELVDLESRSREIRSSILRVQAQTREVQSQLAREPRERLVAVGQSNPRVATLQARLADAMAERATLLHSYWPGSPKIRAVDAQLASVRALLAAEPLEQRVPLHVLNERYGKLTDRLDNYQAELEGLQAQYAQLEPQLSQRRRRLDQLGPWEVRLAQLQRSREMAEKSYLNRVNQREDLEVRENARRSIARIVERARTPGTPVRPRPVLNLAVSLILGLFFGFCLAFVQESLDERLTTPEQVDRLLGLPVLGTLPAIRRGPRLLSAVPSPFLGLECYRRLRAGISFAMEDASLSTLAVTSAHAGEGKSTTAVNLALAMAMEGRDVALVDADLRQPSLHKLLGLPLSPGLTDVLAGRCSLEDAFHRLPERNLLVVTSGPIPPNPSELLDTAAMGSVVRTLCTWADRVIFDTPACVPVTDTEVLGAKLDGVVLVAAMGEARQTELQYACEILTQARVRILGLIFNKTPALGARLSAPGPTKAMGSRFARRHAPALAESREPRAESRSVVTTPGPASPSADEEVRRCDS